MKFNTETKKLGEEPIKKLLIKLSVPSIIALCISSTYNLVDTIFVGKLGVDAISALSIAFPVQIAAIAVAVGTGTGISSYISRLLGKGEKDKATLAAGNAIVLSLIYWLIFAFIGYFFSEHLMRLFISDPTIVAHATAYIRIILMGSVSMFYLIIVKNTLRGQGNVILPTLVMVFSVLLNIVLDAVLIFGLFGFPAFGIKGAAIATVTARGIGCIFMTFVLLNKRSELNIKLQSLKLNINIVRRICEVGIPTIMIQLVGSITLIVTNKILEGISIVSIAVFGIFFKIQSFVLLPLFGLSQSLIPIIGYNYGAKNNQRIREILKSASIVAFIMTFIVFLVFQFFPGEIIKIFNSDPVLVNTGVQAFRRITLLFFIVGPGVIMMTLFQATGAGMKAFLIFAVRQIIAFIPLFYCFSIAFNLPDIWFAFPISDAIAVGVGGVLSFFYLRKLDII